MIRSLRWRLQAWYTVVLLAVVGGFAGILDYRERVARFHDIDRGLESWAQYLDATLRSFPPYELDGKWDKPPGKGPWPGPGKDDKRFGPPPPPGRSRERLLSELDLPRSPPPPPHAYFAVWRANGTLLKSVGLDADTAMPPGASFAPGRPNLRAHGDWRDATLIGPQGTRILVGRSIAPDRAHLNEHSRRLALIGAGVLAVGLAGGAWIASRILRPLAAISATAAAISATNLSARIETARLDSELVALAEVLNETFARLEEEFARQTRFTADASHELRTPLTLVRTHAELALSRPRSADEYRQTLAVCLRATQRMTGLVEQLLTLARADAGRLDVVNEPLDLCPIVAECLTLLQPLAANKHVTVEAELAPAMVVGDGERLAQVATNLLANAVQYNRPGGQVRVRLQVENDRVELAVTDTGDGIAEPDQAHLFERFYRVDKARSRASGGSGLGLAICKSIVTAHGGTIDFTTHSGHGSTFRVRLPRA